MAARKFLVDILLPNGSVTASSFVKNGGLISQFLKADGSIDSSAYLTSAVTTLSGGTTGLTPNTATSGAITLAGTLVVANGGTGSTTAAGARTNLGATTVGGNVFTSTNPTAITFLRANADNTVSWLDAATFRTAIGAGTSTVTPSALTKVDDTNVTLTLGGTPATALLQGVSLTLGWTGTLADGRISSASTWNSKQAGSTNLTSLSGLTFASTSFVKMTALGTFALDTNTYLSSISGITAGGELSGTYPNPTLLNSAVIGKVLTGINITGGTISATDSILTAFGKVQNQINGLIGGTIYQSTWNASTNTPTLNTSVGTKGYYYIVSVAGSTNLNGITDWKVGDWAIYDGTAWQKVDNTDAVSSVNGFTGAVSLTTANISENTNLYYTDARARASISLTTTGASGASTYSSATGALNIPTYTLSGLGGQASSTNLTSLSGLSYVSTSFVKMTAAGTFALDTNTYYLSSNPSGYTSNTGTVTSVAALTLGTTGTDLSSSVATGTTTPVITLNVPTASATNRGALSSTDWSTFNNKQNALTNPITGTGTTNYLPKFTGASALGNSIIYDNGSGVGIGTTSPAEKLDISGNIRLSSSDARAIGGDMYGRFITSNSDFTSYINFWGSSSSEAKSMQLNSGSYISFVSGSSYLESMRIAANGNVLIGTTTDNGSKLIVNGSGYFDGGITAASLKTGVSTYDTNGLTIKDPTNTTNVWSINKGAGDGTENWNFYNFGRSSKDFQLSNATGVLTLASLAGTGTRMVIADLNGNLSTQVIPSSGGSTNLSYTASSTNGVVASDTGTDATIPLADGTYAGLLSPTGFTNLSNAVLLSGNQSITNIKSFTNTGTTQNNGLSLLNNGTSGSYVFSSSNTSSGLGSQFFNNGSGVGLYSYNSGVGIGIDAWNLSSGSAIKVNNNSGGVGLYLSNLSSGIGAYFENNSLSIGNLLELSNNSTTSSTSALKITLPNLSTGTAIIINSQTSATGIPFTIQKNAVTTFTVEDNGSIDLLGTNAVITAKGITNEPTTPSADNIVLYAKKIGGKMVLKTKDEYGVDFSLQNSIWDNNITYWSNTNATAGVWQGTVGAGAGTFTQALPTTTSIYTSIKRARYANVVTTTNQVLGQRNTEAMFFRGGLADIGGFFFYARFGFDVFTNGSRLFAGFHSGTTVISADPSALNNTMGFCIDAADNGAISFLTRGTVATKASTGFTAVTGKGYDVYMYAAPNASTIYWKIEDLNAGTEVSGTATANLPTNTTMLTAGVLASNGALTTVTATQLGINKIYIETDY